MKPSLLELFYADEHTRESFREFQSKVLEEMILEDCYTTGGDNSKALQQTKKLIDKSYKRLDEIFGRVDKPSNNDSH